MTVILEDIVRISIPSSMHLRLPFCFFRVGSALCDSTIRVKGCSKVEELGMRLIGFSRVMWFLLLAACATGYAAERINQEGRILGPAPTVTTPVLFNTPAADTIVSAMQIYPLTSAWNEDISKLPLLSNSAAMITKITNDLASSRRTLRMFAEMNYILVPDSEPKQDVFFFNYPDESDDLKSGSTTTGSYPIDVNMPIETWPAGTGALTLAQWQQDINNDGGDRHSISVMPGAGFVWETWLTQAFPGQTPPWQASNGAKFDLNSNTLRPDGFTSGDAAGLSMFGALVRYDECERGMVEHAMRIVVKISQKSHIYPATHDAGSTTDPDTPAMGQRIRLNAGFTSPGNWTKEEKAVALALKKYGGLVADNGGFFSISYCPDDRFPAGCFDNLSTIATSNFEIVAATGVSGGPRSSNPMVVNAGVDQSITLATGATLAGTVSGGTNPTIQWYAYPYAPQPGTVNFGNASVASTTATFSAPGTYILMLSADDGVHAKTFDAVNITVANTVSNPVPTLTNIAPTTATTGGAAFTLTLTGTNFGSASVVNWPGHTDLTPATVSATQITVSIPAAYIASAGSVAITVTNPLPGGGTSGSKTFSVTNPAPTLTTITPANTIVGSGAFSLTVNGTNFLATSVVNWAGHADLTPTSVTPTQFTVTVPSAYMTSTGTAAITVTNPAPGGGASSAQTFTVNNPVPTLTTIAPTSAIVGGASFTLTLNGSNFIASSVVNWPGQTNLTPVTVTGTKITVSVPTAYITAAGTAAITVTNPTPGGGVSSSQTFTIANPLPTLTSIAPTSAIVGGASFTLTLTGTNFIASSVVNWPGHANLTPATFTGTQITVSVPAAYIATAGTAAITVTNPTPGGGVSSPQRFTIANPSPTLVTIVPQSATSGGASFTLTLTGTNFVASSVVNWAGHADLTPATVTGTQITVSVPTAYIASAGTPAITITNPSPGGGVSSSQTFTINAFVSNPAPTLGSIAPASATAGSGSFILTLTGTNFVASSVVNWAGQLDLTPATVTGTQITVSVPAAYIASTGMAAITVTNPAPGGGASASKTLAVVNSGSSFLSGPTADTTNPVVGTLVHFSATPPGTNAFTFTWTFGDGMSDTSGAASVAHAYTAAGTYTVQASAVDAFANTVQGSLTITVSNVTPPQTIPMIVTKFVAAIKVKPPGSDTCSISGTLPNLPTPFNPAGTLVLNVNGVMVTFTLDAHGRQRGTSNFSFKLKAIPRVHGVKIPGYQGGNIPFKANLKHGNFASAWGIPAGGGNGVPIPIKVDVLYVGQTYEDNIMPIYKGAAGKNGSLKK